MKVLWKGALVESHEANINIHDRGYQFGDGIYEYIRVYNGNLFYLQEHLQRLQNSADLIDMKLPYSLEEIADFCYEMVKVNQIYSGCVYFQITRGDKISRKHNYPLYDEQEGVLSGYTESYQRPTKQIENGEKAALYPDIRWNLCNAKTLNLLPNTMAISEALKKGATKAILHRNDIVTEEKSSNVMIIKDDVVYTHPDGPEILPGITKSIIFNLLNKLDIEYREETFAINDLLNADEVFVSSTNSEVTPIIMIDNHPIGNGQRGPMTAKIEEAYKEEIIRQCGKVT